MILPIIIAGLRMGGSTTASASVDTIMVVPAMQLWTPHEAKGTVFTPHVQEGQVQ